MSNPLEHSMNYLKQIIKPFTAQLEALERFQDVDEAEKNWKNFNWTGIERKNYDIYIENNINFFINSWLCKQIFFTYFYKNV